VECDLRATRLLFGPHDEKAVGKKDVVVIEMQVIHGRRREFDARDVIQIVEKIVFDGRETMHSGCHQQREATRVSIKGRLAIESALIRTDGSVVKHVQIASDHRDFLSRDDLKVDDLVHELVARGLEIWMGTISLLLDDVCDVGHESILKHQRNGRENNNPLYVLVLSPFLQTLVHKLFLLFSKHIDFIFLVLFLCNLFVSFSGFEFTFISFSGLFLP